MAEAGNGGEACVISWRWLLALLYVLATPAAAQVFRPATFTLANGLEVVVIPSHRVPVVSQTLCYKVGAADERPGKTGLAHMLEHMMFKGTPTVPAGMFSDLVAVNGGEENAVTDSDDTCYYQNIAADRLALVMRLEADRMAHLAPRPESFATEHQVVLEELRMRIENQPEALLDQQVDAALFLNSPYHNPVIGWRPEVEKLTLADVLAFHRRWYAPNNAVLVVAGDVSPEGVRRLAETYYGVVPRRAVPRRTRRAEPKPVAARTVTLRDPSVHQPEWTRLYLAPSYHQGATEQAYPLQVLAEILGDGETSRLYRSLVVERKVAVAASAAYDPDALGVTSFALAATPAQGVTPQALGEAAAEVVASVAGGGITADEVERAKTRLRASVAYARDSYVAAARMMADSVATGSRVSDVEAWPERIAAVTPAEVAAAARAVLRDEGSVTGLLLPTGPAAAGTPESERRPAPQPGRGMR